MEGGKKTKTPSSSSSSTGSSFSNELFGPKGSNQNAPPGIFDAVFSQSSAYSRSEVIGSWRKKDSENQGWNSKQKTSGNAPQSSESQSRGSIFQDHRVEPHSLSSSIYYGGQEVYSTPSDSHTSASAHTQYKKDEEHDDPNGNNLHSASRGNWWQGGLYY